MELRVLGASGGVMSGRRTTSLLLDGGILIDAGSGVGDLDLEAMTAIDHVLLTHSHVDHIAFLPLLADTVMGRRDGRPITVHGLTATLEALHAHVFNGALWPDFTCLPSREEPILAFAPHDHGDRFVIAGHTIEVLPARHTVPAAGYRAGLGSGEGVAVCTDTGACPALWEALAAGGSPKALIIEVSLPDAEAEAAGRTHHYTPATLAADLEHLRPRPRVLAMHLKPPFEEAIAAELERHGCIAPGDWLKGGETFTF